jgi:PAS domain S-box-containing protein
MILYLSVEMPLKTLFSRDDQLLESLYDEQPARLLWSHSITNSLLATACLAMAFVLLYGWFKYRSTSYRTIVILLALFFFSCGIIHGLEVIARWLPTGRLDAFFRVFAALVALTTTAVLIQHSSRLWAILMPEQKPEPHRTLKETTAELDASRHFIEKMMMTIPNSIYLFDLNSSQAIYTNRSLTALLGYDAPHHEAPDAVQMSQLVHPDDVLRREQYYRNFAEAGEGEVRNIEFRLRHANGSYRHFLFTNAVFRRNAQGIPDQLIGISQDITPLKQTERVLRDTLQQLEQANEQLRQAKETLQQLNQELEQRVESRTRELMESNERYQLIGRATHEVIWDWDLTTQQVWWNEHFYTQFGYDPASMPSDSSAWSAAIPPADKARVMARLSKAMQARQQSWSDEYPFLKADGTPTFVLNRGYVQYRPDGRPIRMVGAMLDMTKHQAAQQQLAREKELSDSILNRLPGIFYIYDQEGHFLRWNKNLETVSGYRAEEVATMHPLDFFGAEEKILVEQRIRQVFTEGPTEVEAHFLTRDGRRIPYLLNGYSIIFEGQPCLIGMGIDLTQRRVAEQHRDQMAADLLRRNQDLEQFTYIVSHNLRAPVASIMGLTEVIHLPGLGEDIRQEMLSGLARSARKLDEIIIDLNTILQVRGGSQNQQETVSLTQLIADLESSLHESLRQGNVRFEIDFSQADQLLTIKSYLYSIFYNLISNSLKYRRNEVPLVIAITSRKGAGPGLVITYRDNGQGIDLQRYGHQVFGLYKRFHVGAEGKGMGLFMVKTQVETLGGRISIDSQVDQGTTFTLTFEA